MAETVAGVDGVRAVAPQVEGIGQVLDADGEAIGADGPPTMAEAWIDDPDLTAWEVTDGRAPTGPGEVVLDRASAETAGVVPGDQVTVLVPDPVEVDLVGIVSFGDPSDGNASIGDPRLATGWSEPAGRQVFEVSW